MKTARGFIIGRGGVIVAIIMALTLSPVGLALGAATLTGLDIVNGSIKTVDLGKGAVTGKKLHSNSVGSAKIIDGSIKAVDLAAGVAISGPKGDKGDTGEAGTNGLDGADGLNGIDGIDGAPGPTYVAGNGSITIDDTSITVSTALIDYINALEARVADLESTSAVPYVP